MRELISDSRQDQPYLNHLHLLDTGDEALRVRAALIDAASCRIDLQYYIWNSDTSGRYLVSRLLAAADRGVHIRLLLDDINVASRESLMALLATHDNIEVQIYNPFSQRRGLGRAMNLASEFGRLNRRMHVKSFTVDQSVTILGGRNIGDEYFDLHHELNFRDRDVLVTGPVVDQTMAMFEEFWNWSLSRPVAELTGTVAKPDMDWQAHWIRESGEKMNRIHPVLPENNTDGRRYLVSVFSQAITAPAHLIHDPPPDARSPAGTDQVQPGSRTLMDAAAESRSDLLIESAYLVADEQMLNRMTQLQDRGVRIRALTNSLASNDVTANHASYARRRKDMLRSGMEIYELRPDAASCPDIILNGSACGADHIFGLHAKTYVIDLKTLYIGSLNLNLRSRFLNAEAGVLIENRPLATRVARDIEANMTPDNSWRPVLDEHNRLRWIDGGEGGSPEKLIDHEPEVGWLRRLQAGLLGLFPIDRYF
ncbi:MAG: phospholipase D family protein [Pseudomonadales bacterium]|nr:phospholipase D family protein [Pseudomonadales bacterium]